LQTSKSLFRSSNWTSSSRLAICIASSPDILPPLAAANLAHLAGRGAVAVRSETWFAERKRGADPGRTTPPNGARKPAAGAAKASTTTHAAHILTAKPILAETKLSVRRERGDTGGRAGLHSLLQNLLFDLENLSLEHAKLQFPQLGKKYSGELTFILSTTNLG